MSRGLAWTASLRWVSQILSWFSTFALIRLLVPADYGVVALAASFSNWTAMLAEFGLTAAITTSDTVTDEEINSLAGISALLGLVAGLLTALLAFPVARFFDERALLLVVPALGAGVLLDALRVTPLAAMNKALRIREVALIDFVRGVLQTALVLSLALLGFRYWALVLGQLGASLVASILALRLSGVRVSRPSFRRTHTTLQRARMFFASGIAYQSYRNADTWIIGRILGADAVGVYGVARNLATLPLEKLVTIITATAPGYLLTARRDLPALRRMFLRLTEAVALISVLPLTGLALTADFAVPMLLGMKWSAAIEPIQVMCVGAVLWGASMVAGQVAALSGNLRIATAASIIAVPVSVVAYMICTRSAGLTGAAIAWNVVVLVVALPSLRVALQVSEMTLREYARAWRVPLLGCLGMTLAVLAVRVAHPASWPDSLVFATCVAVGSVAAFGILLTSGSELVVRLLPRFALSRRARDEGAPAKP